MTCWKKEEARAIAARRRLPFRAVINEALGAELKAIGSSPQSVPYETKARALGLKAGRNLDNIQALLARIDGEDSR